MTGQEPFLCRISKECDAQILRLANQGLFDIEFVNGRPQPAPFWIEIQKSKLPEPETMALVLYQAGVFPSISQARKNGWNKPVRPGEFDIGKGMSRKRIRIT